MPGGGGPCCPPPLLCLLLLTAAGDRGSLECREKNISANGVLELLLERIPQRWTRVEWRVRTSKGLQQRIVTAERNDVQFSMGPFFGRAVFQNDTLSLRISPISTADSGVYVAEFQDTSGTVTSLCFRVSVWEPVRPPQLEARVLHREPGRCNLSLLCTVPAAANVSYSWSCGEGHIGAMEPRLQLPIRGDIDSVICSCNASNPASWSTASTDAAATCAASGLFSFVPWGAVAVSLGLALAVSVAIVITWRRRRKRGGDPSGGDAKQMTTVYAEVGKARSHRDPNGTGEAAAGGNTVYAVICTQAQRPSRPQEPESCTIYATVQPTRKPSSLKRKRLDPALTSTAYAETTVGSRRSHPSPQTLPPVPPHHHLS